MTENIIKKCSVCHEEKNISFFSKNNKTGICKKCVNKINYNKMINNPDQYAKKEERRRVRRKLQRKEMGEKLNGIKVKNGCLLCGYKVFGSALVFHHINPDKKTKAIGRFAFEGRSWKNICEEINKCIVLCFNCHIALHANLISPPNHLQPLSL